MIILWSFVGFIKSINEPASKMLEDFNRDKLVRLNNIKS
jgi:hypothetical protein